MARLEATFKSPLRIASLAVSCLGVVSCLPTSAMAQAPEQFFAGRTLTLVLGGGAGGSVDIYGRLIAQHIVRYLPGNPSVVVKNFPAAGGIQAYMTLATSAPRDGSTFATFARGPLTDPVFDTQQTSYDVRRFNWLGSLNDDTSICYTLGPSRIKTIEDARRQDVTMASTGATAESGKFPLVLNAALGTRFKVINGYSGVADTMLAIEKGETDGRCTTVGNIRSTRPDYLKPGQLNVLVQIGRRKEPVMGDVPLATDLATTDAARELLRFIGASIAIDAPFALPEGVPEDRAAIWKKAFASTLTDAQFLADASRVNFEVRSHTGAEVKAIIDEIYSLSPESRKLALAVFSAGR